MECIFCSQSGALIRAAASSLHICVLAKEDLNHTKDAKFAPGIQVSCPYLQCGFKNSQFNAAGRFPSGMLELEKYICIKYHSGPNYRTYFDLTFLCNLEGIYNTFFHVSLCMFVCLQNSFWIIYIQITSIVDTMVTIWISPWLFLR